MGPTSAVALILGILALFLALRIPLLVVRQPFFDELVTVWFAERPLTEHWALLMKDSGPPLYYALCRVLEVVANFEVIPGRILSLHFAVLTLMLCFVARRPFAASAGAILAVFPAHLFFSTEARAYALAALLVGCGVVALARWTEEDASARPVLPWIAALAFTAAAYTHWYGVLFFPLPLVAAVFRRKAMITAFFASIVAGVLFLPGFLLARAQPVEATAWMEAATLGARLKLIGGTIRQLGFAAPFPAVFAAPPPRWLQAASLVVVVVAVVWGCVRSVDARFFGALTITPLAGVVAVALLGRTFYFPMRFESVLALPFVFLLAASLFAIPRLPRVVLFTAIMVIGMIVALGITIDHSTRPTDPYRRVARFITERNAPSMPLVASGYAFLEVVSATEQAVIAFPREQAGHPGWKGTYRADQLRDEAAELPDRFVWIGAAPTAEAQVIVNRFRWREIARDGAVVALLVEK